MKTLVPLGCDILNSVYSALVSSCRGEGARQHTRHLPLVDLAEPPGHAVPADWRLDAADQPVPQSLLAAGAAHDLGQRAGVADVEMQAVDLIGDAFLHAADIGCNHRALEHPGLGDDQPEYLPPNRRDDAPIDARHAAGELSDVIRAVHDDVAV